MAMPPLPGGAVCVGGKKGGKEKENDGDADDKGKKKSGACGGPPEAVPEPGTWLLFLSGLAGVYCARRKLARV